MNGLRGGLRVFAQYVPPVHLGNGASCIQLESLNHGHFAMKSGDKRIEINAFGGLAYPWMNFSIKRKLYLLRRARLWALVHVNEGSTGI